MFAQLGVTIFKKWSYSPRTKYVRGTQGGTRTPTSPHGSRGPVGAQTLGPVGVIALAGVRGVDAAGEKCPKSHPRSRVTVLTVLAGPVLVLDGELGAAVQAAQAHDTALLHPDGPPAPHLDGLVGALPRTEPAANAGVIQHEVGRLAHLLVLGKGNPRREAGHGAPCEAAALAPLDPPDDLGDLLVCLAVGLGDLVRV